MVTTRRQSKQASNGTVVEEQSEGSKMTDEITENETSDRVEQEIQTNTENQEKVGKILPENEGEKVQCDHSSTIIQPKSNVRHYLKGFVKRVIFCTLLVILVRSLWPKVQPYVWPEDAVKEGKMYVLSSKSFRSHVARGDHFLMMYAPWCGHCQQLKPSWEKLSKSPGVAGVKVGKVDCTAEDSLCKEYSVQGYPTLLYFRNGAMLKKYEGDKSLDALKAFVKKMAAEKPAKTAAKKAGKKKSTAKPKKQEL